LTELLISDAFVDDTRSKIKDSVTFDDPEYYGAVSHTPEDNGTSHVSVVDGNGMAVAVTSTINLQLNKKKTHLICPWHFWVNLNFFKFEFRA
jgi:gamma-glutamyltranspeptidase/glutathione hydrolase/leukotriene-C4 hydrolase